TCSSESVLTSDVPAEKMNPPSEHRDLINMNTGSFFAERMFPPASVLTTYMPWLAAVPLCRTTKYPPVRESGTILAPDKESSPEMVMCLLNTCEKLWAENK